MLCKDNNAIFRLTIVSSRHRDTPETLEYSPVSDVLCDNEILLGAAPFE